MGEGHGVVSNPHATPHGRPPESAPVELEGVQKKFGRGTKIDPSEWNKVGPGTELNRGGGFGGEQNKPIGHYNSMVSEVTSWHRWKKGKEEVYVAEGTDFNGRKGLVMKLYFNPTVVEEAVRNPNAPRSTVPWFEVEQLGTGGKARFGGGP